MHGLLDTKLYLPEPTADVVLRPNLFARLNDGLSGKLTLVCAPAGFGKTTVTASWLRFFADDSPAPPRRATWYALDETDNNYLTFASYLVAAIRRASPFALGDLVALDRRAVLPEPDRLAVEIAQGCLDLPEQIILVLDDYHVIADAAVHRLVQHLLRTLPPTFHLVITSRHDPPLSLALLRAKRQLSELRSHDLAFSVAEAEEFLRDTVDGGLASDTIGELWERTEGWAAGLRLVSLSLQTADDRVRFVEDFCHSDHRYIADYLVDEVLTNLPPDVEDFLLRTSILLRLSGGLAAAVVDIEPRTAEAIIEHLERRNLFLFPLDGHRQWYRYHSQFRTLLRHRLQARLPADELDALHARAARWLAAQDLVEEALPHFLAAGDLAGSARLVESHVAALENTEQWSRLAQWLAMLPETLVQERPGLLLARAWVFQIRGNFGQIPAVVERAESLLDAGVVPDGAEADPLWGQIHALRGSWLFVNEPTDAAKAHEREALRLLPADFAWVRGWAFHVLATWMRMTGEADAARRMLENEIAANPTGQATTLVRLYYALGVLEHGWGDLDALARIAARYYAVARRTNLPTSISWAAYAQAFVDLQRGNAKPAMERLDTLFVSPDLAHTTSLLLAAYLVLPLHAAHGQSSRAQEILATLDTTVRERGDVRVRLEADALNAYWAMLSGDLPRAMRWARSARQDPTISEMRGLVRSARSPLILARILLAAGGASDLADAGRLVDSVIATTKTFYGMPECVEAMVLRARVYLAQNAQHEALDSLREAIDMGYPRGYRYEFTQHPSDIGKLLRELAHEPRFAAAALDLLQRIGKAETAAAPQYNGAGQRSEEIIAALTRREAEVLSLMAEGMTNKEIAHRLNVSPLTVRTHTVNIFGKLDATNRRHAVARARELGLLPPSRLT